MRMRERRAGPQIGPAAVVLRRRGDIGAERIGGMPAPARVVEKGAGEGDAIGAPLGDDCLGLMRVGDHPDGLNRDLAVAFDGFGERHLIPWGDRRPCCGAIPPLETQT